MADAGATATASAMRRARASSPPSSTVTGPQPDKGDPASRLRLARPFAMESSPVSPKLLLLALLLLLLAPVQQVQARELGGSTQAQHVGGLPSVLVLPSSGGDGAAVPPKLDVLPGVSRSGGLAPPAPKPGYRPQPGHEPSQDVDSSPGVTGNHKLAPPPPAGNPPPHYRRLGPAADLLRVFRGALASVTGLLPKLLNRSLKT
ncbi:uncharacterized protein [Miscanthus floridulus]|uniref:uncharacterized protein n=1 Tax=Miscanthus floridulus TaxID=154761 RepID=UPI003458CF0E